MFYIFFKNVLLQTLTLHTFYTNLRFVKNVRVKSSICNWHPIQIITSLTSITFFKNESLVRDVKICIGMLQVCQSGYNLSICHKCEGCRAHMVDIWDPKNAHYRTWTDNRKGTDFKSVVFTYFTKRAKKKE